MASRKQQNKKTAKQQKSEQRFTNPTGGGVRIKKTALHFKTLQCIILHSIQSWNLLSQCKRMHLKTLCAITFINTEDCIQCILSNTLQWTAINSAALNLSWAAHFVVWQTQIFTALPAFWCIQCSASHCTELHCKHFIAMYAFHHMRTALPIYNFCALPCSLRSGRQGWRGGGIPKLRQWCAAMCAAL